MDRPGPAPGPIFPNYSFRRFGRRNGPEFSPIFFFPMKLEVTPYCLPRGINGAKSGGEVAAKTINQAETRPSSLENLKIRRPFRFFNLQPTDAFPFSSIFPPRGVKERARRFLAIDQTTGHKFSIKFVLHMKGCVKNYLHNTIWGNSYTKYIRTYILCIGIALYYNILFGQNPRDFLYKLLSLSTWILPRHWLITFDLRIYTECFSSIYNIFICTIHYYQL